MLYQHLGVNPKRYPKVTSNASYQETTLRLRKLTSVFVYLLLGRKAKSDPKRFEAYLSKLGPVMSALPPLPPKTGHDNVIEE